MSSAKLPDWPKDEFERYVRAMPQSEAQTALIFFVNFVAELLHAQAMKDIRAMDEMNGLKYGNAVDD